MLGRRDAADLGDEALLGRLVVDPSEELGLGTPRTASAAASFQLGRRDLLLLGDLVVDPSEELGLGTPRTASAAASFQLGRRDLLLLGESRLVTPLGRRDL